MAQEKDIVYCNICLETPKNPAKSACRRHVFCNKCLKGIIKPKDEGGLGWYEICTECRGPITQEEHVLKIWGHSGKGRNIKYYTQFKDKTLMWLPIRNLNCPNHLNEYRKEQSRKHSDNFRYKQALERKKKESENKRSVSE